MATKPKTLADLNNLHDPDTVIKRKIDVQLAAMMKVGAEEWDYNLDFSKKAGVGVAMLAKFEPLYKAHIGVTKALDNMRPKTVWFACPKVAKKFRGE